jgi:hypothetical protein
MGASARFMKERQADSTLSCTTTTGDAPTVSNGGIALCNCTVLQ